MPHVTFDEIKVHHTYSRHDLARLWGYSGYEAIARGVVTPVGDNKIILFVTETKREGDKQYEDSLRGSVLHWDGPNDHFAEQRMMDAAKRGDEIHLFYRDEHHRDLHTMADPLFGPPSVTLKGLTRRCREPRPARMRNFCVVRSSSLQPRALSPAVADLGSR